MIARKILYHGDALGALPSTDCCHGYIMMQRLTIGAEPELVERVKRRAAECGVSVAQFVREALERELAPASDATLSR